MSIHTSPSEGQLLDLVRLYRYDRRLGCIVSRASKMPVTKNNGNYIQIRFGGRTTVAHKAAWYLVKGYWPTFELDHKDGIKTNNRITNLRPATRSTNSQNQRRAKVTNKTGFLGVHAYRKGFRASISVGGTHKCLGAHSTPETAHAAYVAAKRMLHPFGTI